jgi:hypothetical protein
MSSLSDEISIAALIIAVIGFVPLYVDLITRRKERKDKVIVTRFEESKKSGTWFVRVRPKKDNLVEDCTVSFDGGELLTKDSDPKKSVIIYPGGGQNFMFWATKKPDRNDNREIIVKEKGKTIYHRKYSELNVDND